VDKIFSRVDATDAQKSQITAIASAAYKDLAPMRTEMKQARGQAMQLLTAETIDSSAIDALRSSQAQNIDGAMTRATSALTDIANVLTPEQRAQVREKMSAHMDKHNRRGHRFWHRG
jgi:Spy/CpxP family protein refolding chaperone